MIIKVPKHKLLCLYLFLSPFLFKLGGTVLLSMNLAIIVHTFLWFIVIYLYWRVVSVPILLFIIFSLFALTGFFVHDSNPRSLITLFFIIYLIQFLVVSDQKFAHQYHVFVAYGFILMMIVLVVGNLMHSGLDAFRVNSFGKNLLHQHVKANASFGGNKNSLAGGIFYGFIGLTVLQLLSRIKFKYYSIIVLILLVLLLNTASLAIVAMVYTGIMFLNLV